MVEKDLRVVVLGAGMAGILAGIKLQEAGITNVATMKIASSATIYRGLGVSEKSVHGIGHNESSNGKTGLECRAIQGNGTVCCIGT